MRISRLSLGSLLLAAAQLCSAHSWIEQLMVIAPNGTMVGAPGFPRGNALRTIPGFNDGMMVYSVPGGDRTPNDIRPTDLMCKSTQTSQINTAGSPRLQAAPGAAVALRYQENGHVTQPQIPAGKPFKSGYNYVYLTTQSSPDDAFLAIHRQWTPDGKGGDGRGSLISTQNYDDGQCYQPNAGPISVARQKEFPATGSNLWCQQDISLPSTLKPGTTVTLMWVWDWFTAPGIDPTYPVGKQEFYTTCMDIDIVDNSPIQPVSKTIAQFVAGQNINVAAVPAQFSDITNPTAVTQTASIAFSASASGPASGQAAAESANPTSTDDSFLDDHTTSTVSFTVVPIGAATPSSLPAAPAGANPTSGPAVGGQGSSNPPAFGQGPFGNAANVPMSTYTQYDTKTETVYQTIYQTQYTKRSITAPTEAASATLAMRAEPSCSKQHNAFRLRARLPFVRNFLDIEKPSDC